MKYDSARFPKRRAAKKKRKQKGEETQSDRQKERSSQWKAIASSINQPRRIRHTTRGLLLLLHLHISPSLPRALSGVRAQVSGGFLFFLLLLQGVLTTRGFGVLSRYTRAALSEALVRGPSTYTGRARAFSPMWRKEDIFRSPHLTGCGKAMAKCFERFILRVFFFSGIDCLFSWRSLFDSLNTCTNWNVRNLSGKKMYSIHGLWEFVASIQGS